MTDRAAVASQRDRERPKLEVQRSVAALFLVFAGIALANITLALQHGLVPGQSLMDTSVSFSLGALGAVLIWLGLRADDTVGSIMGYAGGALLWMGFFEWTWANFSLWLGVDPLVIDGQVVLPAQLLLVQASSFIFLPLAILSAANKDTRCRMMQWFRRRLGMATPPPSPQYSHNAARVSATETLFIIWFIYLLNIALYDPRSLGRSPELYYSCVLAIALWGAYLVSKLLSIRDTGIAIRYAIPTAYLLSIPVDAMAMAGWFPAVWVQPFEYPLSAIAAVVVFGICSNTLYRRSQL